jgi:hypothetical protein
MKLIYPRWTESLVARLSDKVTGIRVVYRRDYSVHAMVIRWLFGFAKSRIYELLIEITSPYKVGEDLWPFTLEAEMDLLHEQDERWDVGRVFVQGTAPRQQMGTVVLRRFRNRRIAD